MLTFLAGLGIGVVVTAVVFIVFGRNNRNKIDRARDAILNTYREAGGDRLSEIIEKNFRGFDRELDRILDEIRNRGNSDNDNPST
jgi:uncharacterized membrane protein YgaE (UPF0421/DUF939 family)